MTKPYESESFYKSELDELYKILNEIDSTIVTYPSFISSLREIRDTCLFRINLVEGWLAELAILKIN